RMRVSGLSAREAVAGWTRAAAATSRNVAGRSGITHLRSPTVCARAGHDLTSPFLDGLTLTGGPYPPLLAALSIEAGRWRAGPARCVGTASAWRRSPASVSTT